MPVPMFGTGIVTAIPSGSTPTPVRLVTLQDVSLDIGFTEKELRGENQFADDIAHGDGKLGGKAKNGKISSGYFGLILAGGATTAGTVRQIAGEQGTVPAPSGPYTVQVSQHANFEQDDGVLDTTTGAYMTRVASGPTQGQYSESGGTYTFNSADTGLIVKIYYTWSDSTSGVTTAYTNQQQGTRTAFRLDVFNTYNGKSFGYRLWSVSIPKLSLAAKNNDYTMQDIDFSCFTDNLGRTVSLYTED